MSTLSDRVDQLAKHFGTQDAVAIVAGVEKSAISRWRSANPERITALPVLRLQQHGVRPEWLLLGEGPMLHGEFVKTKEGSRQVLKDVASLVDNQPVSIRRAVGAVLDSLARDPSELKMAGLLLWAVLKEAVTPSTHSARNKA